MGKYRQYILFRMITGMLLLSTVVAGFGQFPYVRKLNYPEQLPTQVVYDMLSDSKGYIWLATDLGLFKSNGKNFTPVPFDNTTLKSVSYLQEDPGGMIWCMNFYNQLFAVKDDTLRRFVMDSSIMKDASTFLTVNVGRNDIWFRSFNNIFKVDKASRKVLNVINLPTPFDVIISSGIFDNQYQALSYGGYLFQSSEKGYGWKHIRKKFSESRLMKSSRGFISVAMGTDHHDPVEIINGYVKELNPIKLSGETYVFQGVEVDSADYWLCTQDGAIKWDPQTGETKSILPHQRVSDVVKDYQGNYWISTLDNGIFICPSLDNTLLGIYGNPMLDNFNRLEVLPNGDFFAGNTQGLLTRFSLATGKSVHYRLAKARETEFIKYDVRDDVVFFNRGVVKKDGKTLIDRFDYSKGVDRDKFGNILVSVFNGALVVNNHFGSNNRTPAISCPLYASDQTRIVFYDMNKSVLLLRSKRSNAILSANDRQLFWVAYEDGLYQYDYSSQVKILKDANGSPVIGKSMVQLPDNRLVIGSSVKGVMVFKDGRISRTFNETNGLSNNSIRKVAFSGNEIWVLTAKGLDRINLQSGVVTNYLDEYGLGDLIMNDFVHRNDSLMMATPSGILLRKHTAEKANKPIRFPLLKGYSAKKEISNGSVLSEGVAEVSFRFEALHYVTAGALDYRYRLLGLDTLWHSWGGGNNRLTFSRLAAGRYQLQIQAVAGTNYKSSLQTFSFVVPKNFLQKPWVILSLLLLVLLLAWLFLYQWKQSLLNKQTVREQLLKSQLVAIRAQMNPHFLYNVLNTVQGLVYGNRKTEAGALLGNFSDLMRKILQSSDKQFLSLKEEMENLRLYLELEKARFDEGFSYNIEIRDIKDVSGIYIPSLLLQPFAENAIKHGLMHKQGPKELEIRFEKEADILKVTIDDNGIGRERAGQINARNKNKPAGFATQALNERMALFNRLYKKKINCVITDKKDEKGNARGTLTRLWIPDYNQEPDA